jgi:hypothetical protein
LRCSSSDNRSLAPTRRGAVSSRRITCDACASYVRLELDDVVGGVGPQQVLEGGVVGLVGGRAVDVWIRCNAVRCRRGRRASGGR